MLTIREKVDNRRYDKILTSQTERIRYVGHAKKYVDHIGPDGDSKELEALVDASTTLELAFSHIVWGE